MTLPAGDNGSQRPFRTSFLIGLGGVVMHLQQCVRWQFEEVHTVQADAWPMTLRELGSGYAWAEMNQVLETLHESCQGMPMDRVHGVADLRFLREVFGLGGDVQGASLARASSGGMEMALQKELKLGPVLACHAKKSRPRFHADTAAATRAEEWVLVLFGMPLGVGGNGDWTVVCLGTSYWVRYDLLGSLQGAKSAVRRPRGRPAARTP